LDDLPAVDGRFSGVLRDGQAVEKRMSVPLPGGGFVAYGMGRRAWVEASLPKRLSGENVEGVSLPVALELMRELHREVGELVPYDVARNGQIFEAAKVVRLDVVRDFDGVANLSRHLDGLAIAPRERRAVARRFIDQERSAETLRVGPKAWGCTLYDKHAETGGLAPAGRVRFEVRLHSAQLESVAAREHGGKVLQIANLVSDLGLERLSGLRRHWWNRVNFGAEVVGVDEGIERLKALRCSRCREGRSRGHDHDGLTGREYREVFAYVCARRLGEQLADLDFSPNTRRKVEGVVRSANITCEPAGPRAVPRTSRLDFESGRLVAA
jgi:hypothetical protein